MVAAWAVSRSAAVAILWAEVSVTLICLVLRFYTRTRILHFHGGDDVFMYTSMVLFVVYAALQTSSVVQGLGHCGEPLAAAQFSHAKKLELIGHACNIAAVATSKTSVACVLLRLLASAWQQRLVWACIVSTATICVLCIALMFTQCSPLESIFQPTAGIECHFNFVIVAVFTATYTAMMDVVFAAIPWIALRPVLQRKKERLAVLFGLSLGILAGAFGVARAVELRNVSATTEYLCNTLSIVVLSSTELCLSMCCATLPTLRPFWRGENGGGGHARGAATLGNMP